jgi:ATP-binding cassette subfamily F protein uup
MLDRIATEYLALDGKGLAKEFAGFELWQEWLKQKPKLDNTIDRGSIKVRKKSAPVKLSYTLQREFDGMEKSIADAEAEVARSESVANDEIVMADHQKHSKACADVASAHEHVRMLYSRWTELEEMQ